MNLQKTLETKIQRREDLIETDQFVMTLTGQFPQGNFSIFDDDGEKRFTADPDFWDWRDELLIQIEQEIEDVRRIMEIEAMERDAEERRKRLNERYRRKSE